ncbi:MAG: ABC transporter permease [Firmicutes bacterium]|nr:ABC transporter permease [Bacillota bacterium]
MAALAGPKAEPEAVDLAVDTTPVRTYGQMVLQRFLRHRVAVAAAVVLIIIGLSAAFAPWLAPYKPDVPDLNAMLAPPSWKHIMGTDPIGLDLWTQILYGGRISLTIGLFAAVLAVVVGGAVGSLAGYFGGVLDMILMRVTDVALSVPFLFVVLLLALLIGPTPVSVVLIIGFLSWMYPARIVRSEFLSLKRREFVEAARAMGMGTGRIIVREIFPNAMAPLIVNCTLLVGQAIVIESAMDFLGAGLTPPNMSWGWLLNQGQAYIASAPWLSLFPGIAIFIVVLCVNLIGDGLRDALDPTSRL